jgi:hypothetical protein
VMGQAKGEKGSQTVSYINAPAKQVYRDIAKLSEWAFAQGWDEMYFRLVICELHSVIKKMAGGTVTNFRAQSAEEAVEKLRDATAAENVDPDLIKRVVTSAMAQDERFDSAKGATGPAGTNAFVIQDDGDKICMCDRCVAERVD